MLILIIFFGLSYFDFVIFFLQNNIRILEYCYVIPGATERFKIMGSEFIVNFHAIFSTTGKESQKW